LEVRGWRQTSGCLRFEVGGITEKLGEWVKEMNGYVFPFEKLEVWQLAVG
jgi:hypothetical protein